VTFDQQLQDFRSQIEGALGHYIPLHPDTPGRLVAAMRHALTAGGKRVRPVLLLAAHGGADGTADPIPAAVALECLHTYSLIHDDLPSMDNSALRRGMPTCHIAFDEATAVLAGDALLTLAFEILSTCYCSDPVLCCALVRELSFAAGASRLVGGQMDDVMMERNQECGSTSFAEITKIEDCKTGALFQCSIRMGLLLARKQHLLETGSALGQWIGRAFQITDDILDATGDEKVVGKTLKIDSRNRKVTAVGYLGLDGARSQVKAMLAEARSCVREIAPDPTFLLGMLDYLETRSH
jgi:geranylgeranyl diphosphate synthase, type II